VPLDPFSEPFLLWCSLICKLPFGEIPKALERFQRA
jgi:hypothetical protein